MNKETLTVRTMDGQEATVLFDEYRDRVLQKRGLKWYVEFKYDEAVALFTGISEAYKGKETAVLIVEQDKAARLVRAERERKERVVAELVEAGRVVGFHYEIGCDCGDKIYFVYHDEEDVSFGILSKRYRRDEKLARTAADKLRAGCGIEMNIDPDLGSYGGWKLTEAQTAPLISAAMIDLKEETETRNKEKAKSVAATAAIYQKAQDTGKPQVLSMYSEDCNRPDYDCDVDNIVTYAMPDGSTFTERIHCH